MGKHMRWPTCFSSNGVLGNQDFFMEKTNRKKFIYRRPTKNERVKGNKSRPCGLLDVKLYHNHKKGLRSNSMLRPLGAKVFRE